MAVFSDCVASLLIYMYIFFRYKFRARPLNHRILQRPQSGPKAAKRTATKPQDPHLHTAQRAAENYGKHKEEEKPFEFHARPIPKAILNGPTVSEQKLLLVHFHF